MQLRYIWQSGWSAERGNAVVCCGENVPKELGFFFSIACKFPGSKQGSDWFQQQWQITSTVGFAGHPLKLRACGPLSHRLKQLQCFPECCICRKRPKKVLQHFVLGAALFTLWCGWCWRFQLCKLSARAGQRESSREQLQPSLSWKKLAFHTPMATSQETEPWSAKVCTFALVKINKELEPKQELFCLPCPW